MRCRYETQIVAACPVDDRPDVYEAVFESEGCIKVEDILAAIAPWRERKAFQETITEDLARTLKCRVTTVGFHSGIKTTVEAP